MTIELVSIYSSSSGVVKPAFLPLLPGLIQAVVIVGMSTSVAGGLLELMFLGL